METDSNFPVVILPGQLVGKKVSHHPCIGDDGEMEWFRGTAIAQQPGKTQQNPDFIIRYDNYENEI